MENELAALVSAQHPVEGSISLEYPPDGSRPSEVTVSYKSTGLGEVRFETFENKAGQKFKRAEIK